MRQTQKQNKTAVIGRALKRKRGKILLLAFVTACLGGVALFCIKPKTGGAKPAGDTVIAASPSAAQSLPVANVPGQVLPQYAKLYRQNSDLAGWLSIEGTDINYPVMQTVGNNEYYLRLNFEKDYAVGGSLFLDERCDALRPTTNQIVYGHNMPDGTMFGPLLQYRDQSFFEAHPQISFDSLYQERSYQILAVFESKVYYNTENVFKYYYFFNAATQMEWENFYGNIKALSLYDTGVTAEYGDTFLTLSTCDSNAENGRFVVVAKLV